MDGLGDMPTRPPSNLYAEAPRDIPVETGDYVVEQELGRGGMGIVYLARHKRLKRPTALKVLLPEFSRTPLVRDRFLLEGRTLASFNHPNIVTIYTAEALSDHQVYLAMEYVPGGDLRKELKKAGKLTPARALTVIEEVLSALDYMHQRGRIHCDLKPGNILLTPEGQVKISDFGLANFVGVDQMRTRTLYSGATVTTQGTSSLAGGTPAYMPPEAFDENHVPGKANDLWAIGIMVTELLTGKPKERLSLFPELPLLDVRWNTLLRGCLQHDPAKRWTAAKALRWVRAMRQPNWSLWGLAASLVVVATAAAVWLPGALAPATPAREASAAVGEAQTATTPTSAEGSAPATTSPGGGPTPPAHGDPRGPTVTPGTTTEGTATAPVDPLPADSRAIRLITETDGLTVRIVNPEGPGAASFGPFSTVGGLLRLRLRQEPYLLEFSAPGHEAARRSVDGQQLPPEIRVSLEPLELSRTFALRSDPVATVENRGRELGLTPLELTVRFQRADSVSDWGEESLLLRAEHFKPVELRLTPSSDRLQQVALEEAWEPLQIALPGGVSIRFLAVPAGELVVQVPRLGGAGTEERRLTIGRPFYLSETEVTQAQFTALGLRNPSYVRLPGNGAADFPVEQVVFTELTRPGGFLELFNNHLQATGWTRLAANLPTDIEWEYACRAGSLTPLQDDLSFTSARAEIARLAVFSADRPRPVRQRAPNRWGFFDLHGNVSEWTREGSLRGGDYLGDLRGLDAGRIQRGSATSPRPDPRFGFRLALYRERP